MIRISFLVYRSIGVIINRPSINYIKYYYSMETISETDILKQDSNELFREYLHKIKDLIVLDENSIQHIQSFTKEE